jgi:DNA-binding CsgD family transcriptional regulator
MNRTARTNGGVQELQRLFLRLSPREAQVFRLFAEILNCKTIARRLGTEVQTVRNQLASIRSKLGSPSREHLLVLAVELKPWLLDS